MLFAAGLRVVFWRGMAHVTQVVTVVFGTFLEEVAFCFRREMGLGQILLTRAIETLGWRELQMMLFSGDVRSRGICKVWVQVGDLVLGVVVAAEL